MDNLTEAEIAEIRAESERVLADNERLRGLIKAEYEALYAYYNPGPIDSVKFEAAWGQSITRRRMEGLA